MSDVVVTRGCEIVAGTRPATLRTARLTDSGNDMALIFAGRSIMGRLSTVETVRGRLGTFSLEVGSWEGA